MSIKLIGRNPIYNTAPPSALYKTRSNISEMEEHHRLVQIYYDSNPGISFQSNWWAWRTIIFLCKKISGESGNLKINFDLWAYNNVDGLRNSNKCIKLSAILNDILYNDDIWSFDDYCYVSLGTWVTSDRIAVDEEVENVLNTEITYGQIINHSIELHGNKYYPAYRCSKIHLKRFMAFLNECGGFDIE